MRIATWNVNSVRARAARVVDFLKRAEIDVLAMQEIKCRVEQFPLADFEAAGYRVVAHGLNQWNGVAFAYRADRPELEPENVETEFRGMPEFRGVLEARALAADFAGTRLWSLYVPNGRELGHEHYHYKLEWLDRLAAHVAEELEADPDMSAALMGDFNIAPLDSDVWDIGYFHEATHVSVPERQAFEAFEQIGFSDVVRPLAPEGYTYWDYKELRFPRNEGMRIDFVLGSPALAEQVQSASIERVERKGEGPSDHVPVVVELASHL
jgi:exodeoxyribonuclease III